MIPAIYSRRFLVGSLLVALLVLLLAAAFNYLADPYRRYFGADAPLAGHRPQAQTQVPLVKIQGIRRLQPRTLLLGNSRTEIGFDPLSPAFAGLPQPVYNAGMPGRGVHECLRVLQQALLDAPVEELWLGVDFFDFLTNNTLPSDSWQQLLPVEFAAELSVDAAGRPLPWPARWAHLVESHTRSLLSLTAMTDSLATAAVSGRAYADDIDANGFNPLHSYVPYVTRSGYAELFNKKANGMASRLHQGPRRIVREDGSASVIQGALLALLNTAQQRGVRVTVFIHPYHVQMSALFQDAGLWPVYEDWKRSMLATAEPLAAGGVWDFSGTHTLTTPAVPQPGDLTPVQHYWELGHYKASLGDWAVARALGQPLPMAAQDFGVRLNVANIDAVLSQQRAALQSYRRAHPELLAGVVSPAP